MFVIVVFHHCHTYYSLIIKRRDVSLYASLAETSRPMYNKNVSEIITVLFPSI